MTWFIDRRLNGKNKSMVNRQRFLRRYKAQIKQSISEAINKRSVTDVDSGESVSIPTEDISEPMFHQGRGGLRHRGGLGSGQRLKAGKGGQVIRAMTISSRMTELNVPRVAAEVPAVVRARPARMVKVRMNLSFRSRKMSILICSLKIWPYRI
jgi:hypothetical protein